MSCSRPFLYVPNSRTMKYSHEAQYIPGAVYIPCGWCLNCRVDKQNELTHRCEKELINFKCGAFVTLTYDDYHIVDKMTKDINGSPVATLSRSDLKHYMYRLRSNIKNRMPDTLLSNHHFKYLAVGEYGGDGQIFDRPHLHLLLFGLDYAVCKREIQKAWQGKGITKVLPILNGGIQYVLKYLDKQMFGELAQIKYDNNNIERPFQVHSLGLGSSLYTDQLSYIKTHNGCYRWKGKDVPIPPYYKNKYYIKSNPELYKLGKTQQKYEKLYNIKFKSWYDLHEFKVQKAQIRQDNIDHWNRINGKPLYFYTPKQVHNFSDNFIKQLTTQAKLSMYQVPF